MASIPPPLVKPWVWPPAIMSMRDLFDAMRAGFDLRMFASERGQPIYQLSRNNIPAPVGVLSQNIASRAHRNGYFQSVEIGDGRLQFTLKPRAERSRP
jgi:hypothetical protein